MHLKSLKQSFFDNYLVNYVDVPKGTGKILPLVIIESLAMCVAHLIAIYLANSLHFTPFQVGKLISAFSLGTCVGALLSGYLTTKISVIRLSVCGILIYAIGFFLLYRITSYQLLLGILFICGVGGIFMMICNLAALIKLADNDAMKNRLIVLQSVVFNFSYSISSFFMSYFPSDALKNVFLAFGILLLVSSMFMLWRKEQWVALPVPAKRRAKLQIQWSVIATLLPVIFCYGVIYSLIKVYFPVVATTRFHQPLYSWLILSVSPLMLIFFQPLLIAKMHKYSNSTLLSLGALLLGSGYLLFGFTTYLIPSLCCIALAATGEMLFSPISKKLAATSVGEGNEGLGLAAWKLTFYFSGVLGATVVGYIGEYYKDLNIWLTCAPLTLAILLCTFAYRMSVTGNLSKNSSPDLVR